MMLRTEGMMRNAATAKMPNSSFICVLSVPAQNATRTAMPTASPTSVNIGGSAAIVGVALPHADDFIHRAVEVAQHRGIGARDFQVGIAAEGLDHGCATWRRCARFSSSP